MPPEHRGDAASSLPLWAGAIGLALAALGALVLLGGSGWVGAERLNLRRLTPALPGETLIVALGSSKTLTTVRFDRELLDDAPAATGGALRFVRITLGSADYRGLRPALEALEAHPPRLLLLEANLLRSGASADAPERRLRSQLRTGVEILRRLPEFRARGAAGSGDLPTGRRYLSGDENYGGDLSGACVQQRRRWQRPEVREAYRQTYATRQPRPASAYLPHLRRLRAAGTTVVVLDIPPSPSGLSLQAAGLRDAVEAQLRQRVAAEGWLHWVAPAADEALYCDQGHTTPEGQRHFSAWLRDQLSPWLAPRHD